MTPPNAACTFVDSVISLCSKSLASCVEMSAPVPREDMFLLLVRLCGVREARYWAETLGFNVRDHTRFCPIFYAVSSSPMLQT